MTDRQCDMFDDALRMKGRETPADRRTPVVADQLDALKPERIEQRDGVA